MIIKKEQLEPKMVELLLEVQDQINRAVKAGIVERIKETFTAIP